MDEQLLNLVEIAKEVGIGYTTLWTRSRQSDFPVATLRQGRHRYWDRAGVARVLEFLQKYPKWSRR